MLIVLEKNLIFYKVNESKKEVTIYAVAGQRMGKRKPSYKNGTAKIFMK